MRTKWNRFGQTKKKLVQIQLHQMQKTGFAFSCLAFVEIIAYESHKSNQKWYLILLDEHSIVLCTFRWSFWKQWDYQHKSSICSLGYCKNCVRVTRWNWEKFCRTKNVILYIKNANIIDSWSSAHFSTWVSIAIISRIIFQAWKLKNGRCLSAKNWMHVYRSTKEESLLLYILISIF